MPLAELGRMQEISESERAVRQRKTAVVEGAERLNDVSYACHAYHPPNQVVWLPALLSRKRCHAVGRDVG